MIVILGPTASGKTSLAVHVAIKNDGEIISADSRQVYRRMDIGTGKDLCDYAVDGRRIQYHLIDIVEPGTKYNVYQYQHDFIDAYHKICTRGRTPILCGGSGLYLESVLRNYHLSTVPQNPSLRCELEGKSLEELKAMLEKLKKLNHSVMHNVTDVDTCKRAIRAIEIERHHLEHPVENTSFPQIESVIFGLNLDRDLRRQMITERLENRLAHGLVDEIKGLLDKGVAAADLIYYGLEYKYVTEYVIGDLTYEQMFHQLEISIHQFAKRQMTWFRGMERRGICIHWIDASLPMDEKVNMILNYNDDANN